MSTTVTPPAGPLRRLGRLAVNTALLLTVLAATAWVVPSFFGYERYVITGGSMSGTFEKGAVVFEKPVPVGDLQVGDVITYLPPPDAGTSQLVTHRIVRITPGADGTVLRTKGDANDGVDPWTFSLVGDTQPVVELAVPHVGHAMIALADRETRMLLVGVPASLVALLAMKELAAALRRPRTSTSADAHTASTAALA